METIPDVAHSTIQITTPRLTLRNLHQDDWHALLERCGGADVADTLLSIDAPWQEDAVKTWIEKMLWRGCATYRLAICLQGDLIGAVGFAGTPGKFGFGYFLSPDVWGQGYGTEAARGFLTDAFARFNIPAFQSAALVRNVASHKILKRMGFKEVGNGLCPQTATLKPEPEIRYSLSQADFEAAQHGT